MFDWLRKLAKPVESGNFVRVVKRMVKPRQATEEEFISPLKKELTTQLAVKPDIGYNEHCAQCRAHKTVDEQISAAVLSKDDPVPWLKECYEAIKENTVEQRKTQAVTSGAANAWVPSKRFMYGLAAAVAATAGASGAKLVVDLYVLPWLTSILPFIRVLIPF